MMEDQEMTVEKTQSKSTATKQSKAISTEPTVSSQDDAADDVQYLLSQCESLVQDRNSWKERAFEAEKLISELKKDKQELIQAITQTLNIKG